MALRKEYSPSSTLYDVMRELQALIASVNGLVRKVARTNNCVDHLSSQFQKFSIVFCPLLAPSQATSMVHSHTSKAYSSGNEVEFDVHENVSAAFSFDLALELDEHIDHNSSPNKCHGSMVGPKGELCHSEDGTSSILNEHTLSSVAYDVDHVALGSTINEPSKQNGLDWANHMIMSSKATNDTSVITSVTHYQPGGSMFMQTL